MVKKEDIVNKVNSDFQFSYSKLSGLKKEIKEDFKFSQGDQWDNDAKDKLKKRGVLPITINKIKPIIRLLTGIERQSRSDIKVLPEGGEDIITSEITTRLIKNAVKTSKLEAKQSSIFKDGSIGGMSFLEPYIDYSFDLINGELKWKKVKTTDIFFDPDFEEYDMSDCKFVGKTTRGLSKEDLYNLFPNKKNNIDNISNGNINIDRLVEYDNADPAKRYDQYPRGQYGKSVDLDPEKRTYDLIDYYYKDYQPKYYVANPDRSILKQFGTKDEAEQFSLKVGGNIFTRNVPVIMLAQVCGDKLLYNDVSWTYPKWKSYPIIPYFADLLTEDIMDYKYKIQGIVRGIKDLNLEFNKRRSQELHHLNSSANSGFDIEKGSLDERELANLKKYGSSAGIVIQRKRGYAPISRITPMPLSQGHAQLAAENAQDLKEASGVNPDLLASDSKSQSGRAILFKQKQGLVMIQEFLDNYSETKKLVGKFILSQLSELFTVETAFKVLGDAYISDNFKVPVNTILERGLRKVAEGKEPSELEQSILLQYPQQNPNEPILDGDTIATMVDIDEAIQTINNVLSNSDIGKYDVVIGEGAYSDTIRIANFTDLKELAQQGVPIPPQSLIELSMIPESDKKNILGQLAAQAQAQATQAQPA